MSHTSATCVPRPFPGRPGVFSQRSRSDPLAVPEFIFEMRARGHDEATIRRVVYDNPLAFFAQCPRFAFTPRADAGRPAQ